MPLAVMLASVASSLADTHRAVVYVLEHDISDETKKKVESSIPADRMSIRWLSVFRDRFVSIQRNLRAYEHYSIAGMFRLFLPEVLPPSLDKVLYLDCDIVVQRDLGQLWDLEVGDSYVLAVTELNPACRYVSSKRALPYYRELGLAADLKYFNAGVLVVNLRKWRAELFTERALNHLSEAGHVSRWHDQDALNAVIAGEWSELDPRWNVTLHASSGRHLSRRNNHPWSDPFIVHFTSSVKPWHTHYPFSFRDLFLHHLDRTAWANWRPSPARFDAARRWTKVLVKAARKRIHAAERCCLNFSAGTLKRWQLTLRPLKKLDQLTVPKNVSNEIRLFIVLEEWTPVLPFLLSHYLKYGVDRALIILSGSGFKEAQIRLLLGERVHVFATGRAPRHQILRGILDRYGRDFWCLLSDGDELLLYPYADKISLRSLCAHLESVGSEALPCQILDMVPPDGLSRSDCRVGENPLAIYSRFDPRYRRVKTIASDPMTGKVFGASLVVGVEERNLTKTYPCRSKVALLKYRKDIDMAADLRAIFSARLSEVEGAILRFRPCQSSERLTDPSGARQRAPSASPFPTLEKTDPRAVEDQDRSCYIQFQDESQLVRLGLLRSSAELERYVLRSEDPESL